MGEMTFTQRGFAVYDEFVDTYGSKITVQESSNINPAVWIFCTNDNGFDDPSPHLDAEQIDRLIAALQAARSRQFGEEPAALAAGRAGAEPGGDG